jgi:proteasome lid subunit RPN8/RPN11
MGPAVGRLVVSEVVLRCTSDLLLAAGYRTPSHEGLVWWLGREIDADTLVMACIRPTCSSGPQFVRADEWAAGAAARAARALRLGIVAQVHSHPGPDTRHSDGDDDLVFMPHNGMFSLVVGNYGSGSMLPQEGAGLHQFQGGRWVQIHQEEPALTVVAAEVSA